MKKVLFLMAVAAVLQCFSAAKSHAQVLLGLPYEKIHTINRKPVPYQYVRESDVMWSKIIWRRIELSEKANQHLYFPTVPMDGRMSLIDVILDGIHTQGLTAYNSNGQDEFATIITEKEVHQNMGASTTQIEVQTLDGGTEQQIVDNAYNSSQIMSYMLKELWFFDKQRSVMEVRIIGICPIRIYYKDEDVDQESPQQKQTFWIYFPEARRILSNAECFNAKNDAARLNYEDIFEKRYFSSYIFAESNIYNNRIIAEYTQGQESLLEAEKIKETIFNFEQDLWEY
ncbi:MAG: gliding motility protein GldN [Bacteroidales bacterium]|jgi:gliding motility associated protien GldN|nr:gliding motility protein GldN [Bacteroidales bacterium]MBR6278013.1 gliding motility protein GldN [Bacteroidales bacterium]